MGFIDDMFRETFLVKTEDPHTEHTLSYYKLLKPSKGGLIIDQLGGEVKAETTLADIFFLMEKQPTYSVKGALLTNGYVNIFYVKEQKGAFHPVFLKFGGGGWFLRTSTFNPEEECPKGFYVFSRSSQTDPVVVS